MTFVNPQTSGIFPPYPCISAQGRKYKYHLRYSQKIVPQGLSVPNFKSIIVHFALGLGGLESDTKHFLILPNLNRKMVTYASECSLYCIITPISPSPPMYPRGLPLDFMCQ